MTGSSPKPEPESYTYSWFLPAPGSEYSEPPSKVDDLPDRAEPEVPSEANETPTLYKAARGLNGLLQGNSPREPKSAYSVRPTKINASKLRFGGIVVWSALAGAGLVASLMEGSSLLGIQIGAIAGVWIAVSAAIWLLPSKLMTD